MSSAMDAASAIGTSDFIEKYGLWTDEQKAAATELEAKLPDMNLRTIRVSSTDPHGKLRGKNVLAPLFPSVLRNGLDFSTAIFYFDTADGIVYDPFVRDGSLGNEQLGGFPDVILVPDPLTFRVLPWVERTGWCMGSVYYNDGTPVPFDGRNQLKAQLDTLEKDFGFRFLAGLEVEFYLTKLIESPLEPGKLGGPGNPPDAPLVHAVAPGYAYQSEDHQDQIEYALAALADNLQAVGLPLRTMEDEWGPGQCEFTFSPMVGLDAADAMMLFKVTTKQVARRMGLHASFMCAPGLPGFYPSGWHLHQSLIDADGVNVFATPAGSDAVISTTADQFIAGILEHADSASVFTTPTVNGYHRRKPFSLAPNRATWGIDNRAAMMRVQGGPGDKSTHVENRIGEPAANPYFYLMSQVISGMEGLTLGMEAGAPEAEPYTAEHARLLPTSLKESVEYLRKSALFRGALGDTFIDWLIGLKEFELNRFAEAAGEFDVENVHDWEHREYFAQY